MSVTTMSSKTYFHFSLKCTIHVTYSDVTSYNCSIERIVVPKKYTKFTEKQLSEISFLIKLKTYTQNHINQLIRFCYGSSNEYMEIL